MASEATSPEQFVREMLEVFDRLEFEQAGRYLAEDVQRVDELTGGWQRGRAVVEQALSELTGQLEDVHSETSNLEVTELGDAAVVTFQLNQRYRLGGEQYEITAPTTVLLRREQGAWKAALFHSVRVS